MSVAYSVRPAAGIFVRFPRLFPDQDFDAIIHAGQSTDPELPDL